MAIASERGEERRRRRSEQSLNRRDKQQQQCKRKQQPLHNTAAAATAEAIVEVKKWKRGRTIAMQTPAAAATTPNRRLDYWTYSQAR